jgi:cytochrome c5
MRMKYLRSLSCLFATAFVVGCADDKPTFGTNGDPNNVSGVSNNASNGNTNGVVAGCVPDRDAWDTGISSIVSTHCGSCHGEQPDFGAPYTLTNYEAITATSGEFLVNELAAARAGFGEMPPAGVPDLPDDALSALVDWASCGEITPQLGMGLKVDRPVFLASEEAPDLDFFEVRADDFAVGEDVLDLYQCFSVDAPVDSDQFIRRIEAVVDQSEVLHHVVLLRDPERNAPDGRHLCPGMPQNSDYLYAWAPGGGPIQFPDGGLRVQPGERFVLQIHYNNAIGASGLSDSSGVRLYYDEPAGEEYGMMAPGPFLFRISPSAVEDVSGECAITRETRVLAGMPHMHEIGAAFSQVLERADGTMEPFISLENWQFETQLFYSIPVTMMPGDTLHTTCTFDNPNPQRVTSGERTADEMCFNFMYVTPPPPQRYCDEAGDAPPTDIEYVNGECLPTPPFDAPNLARGSFVFDASPTPTGGVLEPGTYELTGFDIYRDSPVTPIGDIDPETSQLLAKGQLVVTDTEAIFDANFVSNIVSVEGTEFGQENLISIGGAFSITDTLLTLDLTCPGAGTADFSVTAGPDTIQLQRPGQAFNVDFNAVYSFERRAP